MAAARSETKDTELIETEEDKTKEPSNPEAESTGAEKGGKEKEAKEENTVEEEDEGEEEDVTSERCQTAKVGITLVMSGHLVGIGESETFRFANLKSARMNSFPPYSKNSFMTKSRLKKYFAINRIVISTILLIELSTILALTSADANVTDSKTNSGWFKKRMSTEVEEQILDCTTICPVANGNLTLAEKIVTPLEKLTNLRTDELANACRAYVAISQSGFFTLAIILMVMALYTIVESILMLCVIHEKCQIRTLSDRLLFDQEIFLTRCFMKMKMTSAMKMVSATLTI